MIWIAAVLALFAAAAALPARPSTLPPAIIAFYFMLSLTGQLFALPLVLVALVLALFAEGAALGLLAGVAALAGLCHWRNRRGGRMLLDAVGLREVRVPLLAGLVPSAVGKGKVRRVRNLAYGEAGVRNRLDLVLPRVLPAEPMPILIHVHGGAWVLGDTNQQGKPLLHHIVPTGWLGVDVTYRLGPQHRCPAMIVDVLKAIAWVRAHAHEHGGDPSRIAITGGSAGGHLAALAALAHDDPSFKPGFEDADCSVAMALPMYGRYDFLDRGNALRRNHKYIIDGFMAKRVMPGLPDTCMDLWHAMSPLDRVRPDAPPMLVTHGTGDTMLPVEDAREFVAALNAVAPGRATYVELPAIQHAYDMGATALMWAHVRAMEAFLAPLARPAQAGVRRPGDLPEDLPGARPVAALG